MKKFLCYLALCGSLLSVTFSLSAKDPLTKDETDPVMLDLDPYMIDALRSNKMKGHWGVEGSIVQLMQDEKFQNLVKKHELKLFNGPMLGCISATSAQSMDSQCWSGHISSCHW